jgi:hypothetical protein
VPHVVDYMYVCVRGGPNQPLHRDPQWSIVLRLIISLWFVLNERLHQEDVINKNILLKCS